MSTPPHFVLVDFQNVTKVDLDRLTAGNVVLLLFLGHNQKKLSARLEKQIIHHSAEVRLIKVGDATPNALDKRLAGYLSTLCPLHPEAEFYIISEDKDFDLLISYLIGTGLKVQRCGAFDDMPIVAGKGIGASRAPFASVKTVSQPQPAPAPKSTVQPKPKPTADKITKLIQHLRNSPPANRTKLEHMIDAFFKPALSAGEMKGVIAVLSTRGVISIDASNKVTVH